MAWCDRCERYFGSEDALAQHVNDSARHRICDDCDIVFATRRALVRHYVQNHFYCQSCDEHFDDEDELENHHEDHHYYCPACRKIFNTNAGLQQHRQVHTYCIGCERLFSNANSLNTHLRSSAAHNARTHECPGRGCYMYFISYADLAQHLESGACCSNINRSHINALAVRLDKGRVITNPYRLLTSPDGSSSAPRIIQTYATQRSFNGTAYECILCHKTFATLSRLNAHLSSPTHDDKIYRCPVQYDGCRTKFRTLSGLMQHVESESCDIHRFQNQVNNALDNLTSKMRRMEFR